MGNNTDTGIYFPPFSIVHILCKPYPQLHQQLAVAQLFKCCLSHRSGLLATHRIKRARLSFRKEIVNVLAARASTVNIRGIFIFIFCNTCFVHCAILFILVCNIHHVLCPVLPCLCSCNGTGSLNSLPCPWAKEPFFPTFLASLDLGQIVAVELQCLNFFVEKKCVIEMYEKGKISCVWIMNWYFKVH